MTTTSSRASFRSHDHASAWERVREAVKRDWEQTKHDLDVRSGPDLHQTAADTLRQATGREPIPPQGSPNPAHHAVSWEEVEGPYGYGYEARSQYGRTHPEWSGELEALLREEWQSDKTAARKAWDKVKHWVREGYDRARGS